MRFAASCVNRYAAGAPGEIVDQGLVKQVSGLDSRVIRDPVTGTPIGRTVAATQH